MKIGDVPVTVRAAVFPTLTTAMVLGMDFLRANAIAIDIPRGMLVWNRPESQNTPAVSTALPPVPGPSARNPRIRRAPNGAVIDCDVCFQMDNPVVRDLVAELLRGEDPAAAGHRPKSRGIQVGPPMGVAPQLVSRRVQTDGEAPRRDPVARYVPVDQEVCWHCARPGHCRGQCPYPAGPKFCSRCGLVGTTSAACQCGLPERPRRSCPRRSSSGEVRRSISRDSPLPSPRVSPSRRTNAVRGPTGSRM
ncbi:hypothetical protein Zmor_003647 [Zophobas morio]|uniref:CCHC-type domain-containing protein n=1 Tax=Zophobas morio TaxID=2755281 RepID=A0AA38M1F8_9CUCU|nr:hypothetical protein Zmor_003647 [Zophobas morio]